MAVTQGSPPGLRVESALRKVSHGSVKGKGQRLRAGGRLRGYRGVGVEATLPEAAPTTRGRSGSLRGPDGAAPKGKAHGGEGLVLVVAGGEASRRRRGPA